KEIIDHHPAADSSKIGAWGGSRGGMMTYLLMKKVNWLKAAVTRAGLADVYDMFQRRDDMEEFLSEFFDTTEDQKIARSAVRWPEKFPKNVPLLMLHGTADWRVHPSQSLNLSQKLIDHQVPHRLIMYEGGDHSLSEFKQESFQEIKKWFERFLKNSEPLPNLEPHGD
ncbi:MAG: alpha/beta hydrolase family protein, partial [Candidatus Altimarinota bacterium]